MRRVLLVCSAVLACDSAPTPAASTPTPAWSTVADDLGAMTDYMRKSKAAEAKINVGSIARNVQSASEQETVAPDGTVARVALASAPLTPADGPCCKAPKGRCPGGPDEWTHPSWKAIGFELADPHYYAYELVVDATGFVARAQGDLDCDGERSTYELRGTLKPDGTYEIAPQPTSTAPLE